MKNCFICNQVKPVTDFYVHKAMGDGRLNKCKVCCKRQAAEREKMLRETSSEYIENERNRGREKYHRLNYREKKQAAEIKKRVMKGYFDKYPEKKAAYSRASSIKKKYPNNHIHHWSYKKQHVKDVIEIRPTLHATIHRFLKYDTDTFMYRDLDGNLLETKEQHYSYILKVIKANAA